MSKTKQGPLILIVDDDPNSLSLMSVILQNAGYAVAAANGGKICFEILEKHSPDLILCDILMPDLDGYAICERLKRDSKTAEIPLIFLTVNKDPDALIKGFNVGAVDYITKPFYAEELLVRVKTHMELKQSRDKLFETSRQLEESNHRLNKLMEEKDQLLGIVAHDLRNPLAAISSSQKLMSKYFARGEQPADYLIEAIASSCHNANYLIQEILEVAELEQNQVVLDLMPMSINVFLKAILNSFQSCLAEKNLQLDFEDTNPHVMVLLSPQKMTRALENLLNNAIKFTPCEGNIHVRLQANQETVQIEIADSGIGIPEKLQSIVFDKFTKARRKGLSGEEAHGLGMYITREIIHLHQGKIELFSKVNQGTRFIIHLPREQEKQ